ncbi:MAG: hypothetical protein AAF191_18290 [Verrucomicrobiota bacterium]
MNRRQTLALLPPLTLFHQLNAAKSDFRIRYVLSSALFGDLPLAEVLPEVELSGAEGIDIWRKRHATHREQIDQMGDSGFQSLLQSSGTELLISTCYPLGPWGGDEEMAWVAKNGGQMTVCGTGSMGAKNADGDEAKRGVKAFFEKLKPHLDIAQSLGVVMAFENHANSLLHHPDSMRYFAEFNPDPAHIGIAIGPTSLRQ